MRIATPRAGSADRGSQTPEPPRGAKASVSSMAPLPGAGVLIAPPEATDSFVENAAKLLDAGGAEGGWRGYALAGSTLGAAGACVTIIRARQRGDGAAAGAAWFKLAEATLGLVEASGLLHTRPAMAGVVKVSQTFLGKLGDAMKPAEPALDPVARYRAFRTQR